MTDNYIVTNTAYCLYKQPVYAGHYEIAGWRIHFERRPLWLHRWFTKLLLGWRWVAEPNEQGTGA